MPPKVKQTAEEVQAEIDADPLKVVHNPVKRQPHKGINKDLTTEREVKNDGEEG